MDRLEITADRVLREYAKLAFSDLSKYVTVDGNSILVKDLAELPAELTAAISELSETNQGLKIKLHDKKGSLDSLAKHLGLFEKDNEQKKQEIIQFVLPGWMEKDADS